MPFMAPEFFLRIGGEFTTASDIWSLGVIYSWIVSAVNLGKLQHPMLSIADGEGEGVEYMALVYAYREASAAAGAPSWNRELFKGLPQDCHDLADLIFVIDPTKRGKASQVIESSWVHFGDQASTKHLEETGPIRNFKSYAGLSKFDRTVISLVASNSDQTKMDGLSKAFNALDTEKNGRLSKAEIREGLQQCGIAMADEDIDNLFAVVDVDSSGMIDYAEWLSATIGQGTLKSEDSARTIFACLDTSATGEINSSDLEGVLSPEEAKNVFKEAGHEEDKSIDYESFKKVINKVAYRRAPTRTWTQDQVP